MKENRDNEIIIKETVGLNESKEDEHPLIINPDNHKEDKEIEKEIITQKGNEKFIDKLVDYYRLKKPLDEQLIDDLTILFRSEKYKFDINSMIFFFECLNKENEKWDNNEWIKKLYEYKDLSAEKFKETKEKLSELSSNEIYNYKNIDKNIDNKSNNDLGE